ncbi:MAG: LLM class flavin-dependent oxidoreductase [Acidimicrobiales bacterium]
MGRTWGTTEWLAAVCRDAEAVGAGALWALDHLFWGRPVLECLTAATVAVTATRRVAVGSCVLQLPLRSAAAVAKQATSLQLLSGGRFVLGVGTGSHAGEYEAAGAGEDYATRGRTLDGGIAALRQAWRTPGDPSRPYRQEPASPPVPVWIGGSSAAARRRAAAAGDGWVPLFVSPGAFEADIGRLRDDAAAAGRDPTAVTPAVVMMAVVGDGPGAHDRGAEWLASLYGIPPKAFDRHLVAGSAACCAEEIARFGAAGAEHVVVMVADDDAVGHFARIVDAMESERTSHRARRDPLEVPA